jgi:hypothetical protein
MAGLDPAIPLKKARPCHMIGIAGSSQVKPGNDTLWVVLYVLT